MSSWGSWQRSCPLPSPTRRDRQKPMVSATQPPQPPTKRAICNTKCKSSRRPSRGHCKPLERHTAYRSQNKKPKSEMHAKSQDEKKLTDFVIGFWEINKKIPSLRKMCDALNYDTCAQVSALLYRMRAGCPLIAPRKKGSVRSVTGDVEYTHINAWRDRFYLRYRSQRLARDFTKCYRIRQRDFFLHLAKRINP